MPSNSSKSFRVAILGAGGIAVPHALALKSIPNVEMAAVCDINKASATDFQGRWGVREVFTDLNEMLVKAKPDVVHVLLPAAAHAAASETCLRAGADLFVEKPFCHTSEAGEQLSRLAEQLGRRIGVNHNLTYMPGILEAVGLVEDSLVGAVEHVTVHYTLPNPGLARGPHNHWMFRDTGNMLLELGPHPLSVIYRFLGKLNRCSVQASGEMTLSNGVQFFHTWQGALLCERGTGQFILSLGKSFPSTWVHVMGQDGEVLIDLWKSTVCFSHRYPSKRTASLRSGLASAAALTKQSISNFIRSNVAAAGFLPIPTGQEASIRNSVTDFYQALSTGAPIPVGAEEGTAVVAMCEAVIKSALAGQAVEQGVHCG